MSFRFIYVGRIPEVGGTALASIGVCAPALTAVAAFAYMAGIGGASYMSISLGQKDYRRARDILGNAFLLLMGIAVFVTMALLMVRRPVLYMLGCSDVMYPYAETYFTIYICGTAASLCGVYIGFLEICVQAFPQIFTGLFLQDGVLLGQASSRVRMYTLGLLGVAVQYALVDGLTAMGKVRYAFPLSVFRKVVYAACIFFLPMVIDIRFVFYAVSISHAVGAAFSLFLFFYVIKPKLKKELQ